MSFIDARSDTVTKPTAAMRSAMSNAIVGDDVYGEDPTIIELEKRTAKLFEQEEGLFFPTGTMANLTALMCWCDARGSEVILGSSSHIFIYEQGGSAYIGGVATRTIPNESDGTIDVEKILSSIRSNNIHFPVTQLVALENTQNYCGGKVLPSGYIQTVVNALKPYNIPLHIDGARIWNAATVLNQSVAQVTRGASSINVCFSKGLGAPIGSILMGSSTFIAKARRIRKALGGGMRQVGVIGAACLIALNDFETTDMLEKDHRRAKYLGQAINDLNGFTVDVEGVDSNIVIIQIDTEINQKPIKIVNKLKEKGILINERDRSSLRAVTHRDLTDSHINQIIEAFAAISTEQNYLL